MTPRAKLKEVVATGEEFAVVDRPAARRTDKLCEALIETYTSGKAIIVPFNSQSPGAAKYRQYFWRRGLRLRTAEQNGNQLAWVEKGIIAKAQEEPS
jgi:hypothetical protein